MDFKPKPRKSVVNIPNSPDEISIDDYGDISKPKIEDVKKVAVDKKEFEDFTEDFIQPEPVVAAPKPIKSLDEVNFVNNQRNKTENTQKAAVKSKSNVNYFKLGLIILLFIVLLLLVVPGPVRNKIFGGGGNSTKSEVVEYYGLPKVCDLLDGKTAKAILGEEPSEGKENRASTSVITCGYVNGSKEKGVSLIARKFESEQDAKSAFSLNKSIIPADKITSLNITKVDAYIVPESQDVVFTNNNIVYTYNYIAPDKVDSAKLITDLELLVKKLK